MFAITAHDVDSYTYADISAEYERYEMLDWAREIAHREKKTSVSTKPHGAEWVRQIVCWLLGRTFPN